MASSTRRERRAPAHDPALVLSVPARRIRRGLLGVVAVLTLLSLLVQVLVFPLEVRDGEHVMRLIDSEAEANLPTAFSFALLATGAGLAGLIACASGGRDRRAWAALGAVLLALAVDEVAQIHELAGGFVSTVYEGRGALSLVWVIPGSLVAAALAVGFAPFAARLPSDVRRLVAVGAATFFGGALGLEFVEAAFIGTFQDALASVVQEALEMIGAVLWIDAFLLQARRMEIGVRFGSAPAPARGDRDVDAAEPPLVAQV